MKLGEEQSRGLKDRTFLSQCGKSTKRTKIMNLDSYWANSGVVARFHMQDYHHLRVVQFFKKIHNRNNDGSSQLSLKLPSLFTIF